MFRAAARGYPPARETVRLIDRETAAAPDDRRSGIAHAIDYYLNESPTLALRFVAAVEQAFRHIQRHPSTGSPRYAQELDLPGLRCWPLRRFPYLVLARSDREDASPATDRTMNYVKSKQRVADHGEVFTPAWMVEAMLDLVKPETERIDSRFLEPACGSGNFLVRILQRKLAAVGLKYGKTDFDKRHYALLALMCCYGIELLADNIAECRANMLEILADYLKIDESDELHRAASYVLSQNLVHGDALKMRTIDDRPITFAEWGYLGKGKFQRRDFRLDVLTGSSAFSAQGSLFAQLGKHEIFMPTKTYPPMTVRELAACAEPPMLLTVEAT
ncbi:MAG: type II toxin-antitoxin system RelE/ParE family toxin [Thiobacillus sp.]